MGSENTSYKVPMARNGTLITEYWNTEFAKFTQFPKKYSRITDIVGARGKFNPVDQLSFTSTVGSMIPFHGSDGSLWTPLYEGIWFPFGVPNTGKDFGDWTWFPHVSAATLSDWSVDAYNAFNTQVPTKVSLPNFLYELKDMKGMIPSIDRLHLAKSASNNFLAFEFGVMPFISDIKGILALSDNVQKRLKHLLEQQGQSSNLSFNRTQDFEGDPYEFYQSLIPSDAFFKASNRVLFKQMGAKASFHVGGKLYQDLTGLSDSLSTLKALSAAGGFSSPARVIWNAIPYSFVVDWFFHVGKLLDSLTIQPFGGEYRVSNVGYSLKQEATYLVTVDLETSPRTLGVVGYVFAKSYVRKLGYPVTSLFLTNGALTPMQLALSAAMFHQKH
jgi:hypothetical protein